MHLLSWAGAALPAAMLTAAVAAAETPVERGRYLVETIAGCGNCHTPIGPNGREADKALAGGLVVVDAPELRAVSANITPDRATGIGSWTDDQIARAIREGIRPDGSVIGPPKPFDLYRGIGDADLSAMVAYLRTVPPVVNKVERSRFGFPLPPAWGPPVSEVAACDPADRLAYGKYLAGPVGHCVECHTPGQGGGAPDFDRRLGWGGSQFPGPWGIAVAADLTPTHLADWSDAEIARAITTGTSRDGRKLSPTMGFAYYAGIAPDDVAAIVAYLRSLPPSRG